MRPLLFLPLALCLSAPLRVEPLAGRDDPGFAAAFARALNGEDAPEVAAALKTLAEAGNPAATVALRFVTDWSPPKGTLAEKNRARSVNGVSAAKAAAALSPALAVWEEARTADPPRAETVVQLLALGEPERAAEKALVWLNHTGAPDGLPEGLIDSALSDWVEGYLLSLRITLAGKDADRAHLAALLRADHLTGWLTLAQIPAAEVDPALAAAGLTRDAAQPRMEIAGAIWTLIENPAQPTQDEAATVARALAGQPDLLPYTALCAARCPAAPSACTADALRVYRFPPRVPADRVPTADLIAPADFWASARGVSLLLAAPHPTSDPPRDACLAGLSAAARP